MSAINTVYVPVYAPDRSKLMPTVPSRARRWIKQGKAISFWDHGIFCIRLTFEPSGRETQQIAVGIDPGSKKEGYTVKSQAHTYLNIQADAVTWVKEAVKTRREMRRARRFRKTPCRKNRHNRARGGLPPSTKARWQWKLRLCNWLYRLFPITNFIVEDISAKTIGKRKFDATFSPLQVGKDWFYGELGKLGKLQLRSGWETKLLREELGLKKTKDKSAEKWTAHCIDSWTLAWYSVWGDTVPDNTRLLCITPLRFHRRQLHKLQPAEGGTRKREGGTLSHGFKRGSLVKHIKYGVTYVGGYLKDRISLHCLDTGRRLAQNIKTKDCKFLTYNSWRARLLPRTSSWASAA